METELITQIVEAIQARAWYPLIGLAATALIAIARKILPDVWDQIPTRWKPLPALALVAATAFVGGFSSGQPWEVSLGLTLFALATGWPVALGSADAALRLLGGKSPSVTSELKRAASKITAIGIVLTLALGSVGCTALRPAVNALDSVCTLGLVDSSAVQQSAEERGIPIAELAALLCSVPSVYHAWEAAHEQRQDPVIAAVRVARAEGLL